MTNVLHLDILRGLAQATQTSRKLLRRWKRRSRTGRAADADNPARGRSGLRRTGMSEVAVIRSCDGGETQFGAQENRNVAQSERLARIDALW